MTKGRQTKGKAKGRIKGALSSIEGFLIKVLSFLDDHSGAFVAIATFILALITLSYIHEAREMRIETKRLVDTTIEQFKIESYPTFTITKIEGPRGDDNNIADSMKIHNQGSITAFHVTIMLIHAHQKDGIISFRRLMDTVYVDKEKRSTLEFEEEISPKMGTNITARTPIQPGYTIENLRALLVFVRFKVPYDDKFSYLERGYIKKIKEPKTELPSYHWQELNREDTLRWVSDCLMALSKPTGPEVRFEVKKTKAFFKDYEKGGGRG